jgi:LPXTG-motif cell wall-anchored protein
MSLPRTGDDTADQLALGAMAVLLGAALVRSGRRRDGRPV